MTIVAAVPIIAAIIGMVVYLLVAHPRISELGRILFAFAIMVVLLQAAGHVFRFTS